MSKTLLAILSCEKDNELLRRNWPYLMLAKPAAILGAGTIDGKCVWPEEVIRLDTGKLGTKDTRAGSAIYGLVESELDIWRYFLEHPEYDSVCVVEADNIFVRQPPEHPCTGVYLVTLLPNFCPPGMFSTPHYMSTPRWADRKTVEQLHYHGREMFNAGDHQNWISDRFPAHICQRHQIPWIAQPGWSPHAFHWQGTAEQVWIRDARTAIQIGCYALHSVKHQWQLDAIKDLLPC